MMNLINLIGAHVLLKIDENYKLERHDLLIQNNTITDLLMVRKPTL